MTQASSKIALLVTVVIAARMLDVQVFGFVMSLYAVMLIASVIWDLGTSSMTSRDIAAGELGLGPAVRTLVRARLAMLPLWITTLGLGTAVVQIDHPDFFWSVFLFVIVSVTHNASTFLEALLQSQLRFARSAVAIASGRLIQLLWIAPLLYLFPQRPLLAVAAIFAAGQFVTAIMLFRQLRRSDRLSELDAHRVSSSTRAAVARALPYGLSGMFKLGYGKADLILVTALAGVLEAGLYAPATRLQDALMVIPAIAGAALIPLMARAFGDDSNDVAAIFKKALLGVLALSVATASVLFLLIPWLLPLILGSDFSEAVLPARILIWSIPLASMQAVILATLIGQGRAGSTTLIHGVAVLTTVLAHLTLDRRYGAVGGAWASLLREPAALAAGAFLLRRAMTQSGSDVSTTVQQKL